MTPILTQPPPSAVETVAPGNAAAGLQYAPAPPVLRRRWFRRVLLLLIVVGCVLAAWHWHEPVRRRLSLLQAQRQCATHTAPADQVRYDSVPADLPGLANDANYVTTRTVSPQFASTAYFTPSMPYGQFAMRKPAGPWARLCGAAGWNPAPPMTAPLFLHERKNAAGPSRLLVLTFRPGDATPFQAEVITPAGLWGQPGAASVHVEGQFIGRIDPWEHPIRFYAAQPDRADPSRFTFRYEFSGQPGHIDGCLNADDSVTLTLRDGPLKRTMP
jgi:hypothetical protein